MAARKKYSSEDQIKYSYSVFKVLREREWSQKRVPRLESRILKDFNEHRLYVLGSPFESLKTDTSTMLDHVEVLGPPEEKVGKFGRRVLSTPLFYKLDGGKQYNGRSMEKRFLTTKSLVEFAQFERDFYMDNSYHVVGSKKFYSEFVSLVPHKIFSIVIYKFMKFLQTNNIEIAYQKLFALLRTPEYLKLNCDIIYAALMHIRIRGVFAPEQFKLMTSWQNSCVSFEDLLKYHNDALNGILSSAMVSRCRAQIQIENALVEREVKIIRAPKVQIGLQRNQFHYIYAMTWECGIWNKLPKTIQYRLYSGYTVIPEDLGKFTMQSVGASLARGSSPEFRELAEDVLTRAEDVGTRMRKECESSGVKVVNSFSDRAEELIKTFFSNASNTFDGISDKFLTGAQEIAAGISSSVGNLADSLSGFSGVLENIIEKLKEAFVPVIHTEVKLDLASLVEALKYYVIFVNVENNFLKSILFLLMLNSFGLLNKVYMYLKPIMEYVFKSDQSKFTSCDFSDIFGSIQHFFSVIVGTFGSMLSGRLLTFSEFTKLLSRVAGPLRDFVWIDRGLSSLVNLISKLKNLWNIICDWVRKVIWGVTPEKKLLAREVVLWVLNVRFFSTEAGMNAIRLSLVARRKAKGLFSKGQALMAQVTSTGPHPDRELAADLQRCWRDVKIIFNYCTRLEMISQFQPTMFHIQLVGQPGIGKSKLTETLTRYMLKTLFGQESENSVWSYNPNVEHFDGYAGQKAMIVDDMFRYNEPKHLTSLIGLITNTPVMLPMANLEDKGCQLTSELMISSTNKAYPIAKDVFCMEAVFRRRHMLVHVTMDPRVRSERTGSFEMSLFKKYYPGEKSTTFPHLKFSLMSPVPDRPDSEKYESDDQLRAEFLMKHLLELEKINEGIFNASGEPLPSSVLFDMKEKVPEGIQYPCVDWSFDKFLINSIARFRAFKSQEKELSAGERVQKCMESLDALEDILNQQFHVEKGVKLQSTKLLEEYFTNLSGASTLTNEEVDQLITAADLVDASPDIDSVVTTESDFEILKSIIGDSDISFGDFDNIPDEDGAVPSTSAEGNFTGGITLDEERRRRTRILRMKNKEHLEKKEPSPLDDACRYASFSCSESCCNDIQYAKNLDGYDPKLSPIRLNSLSGIKITPDMTYWREFRQCNTSVGVFEWGGHAEALQNVGVASLNVTCCPQKSRTGAFPEKFLSTWWRQLNVLLTSKYLTLPKISSIPEHMQGKKSTLSTWILQNCHWCESMDGSTDFYFHPPKECRWDELIDKREVIDRNVEVNVTYTDGRGFQVPLDEAFYWSSNQIFRNFLIEFDQFGTQAKKDLIMYARWRNQYTGFYSAEALLEFYKDSLLKYPIHAYKLICAPLYSFWNHCPLVWSYILYVMAIGLAITLIRELCYLLIPSARPTSKYMHRGIPSRLKVEGKFTSLLGGENLPTNLASLFRRNVRQLCITVDGVGSVNAQALHTGQFLIFNKHCLLAFRDQTHLILELQAPSLTETWEWIVPKTQIYEDPEGDLAIAYSKQFPSARRIDHHFLSNDQYSRLENPRELIFMSSSKSEIGVSQHQFLRKVKKISLKGIDMEDSVLALGSTIVGKSGSTVVLPSPIGGDIAILGIQAWELGTFFDSKIAIQVVTKEKYESLIAKLVQQVGEIPIQRTTDYEDSSVDGSYLGAFTSAQYNNIITLAPESESVGNVGKTQFKMTPIAGFMARDGFESGRVPAVLNPNDRNLVFGKKIHPLNKSLNKYFKGKIRPYDPACLNYIKENLVIYFKSRLDKNSFRKLEFEEILTGTRVDGSSPMNLKTSPGLPYVHYPRRKKGKKDYFEIDEEGEVVFVSPEIKQDYYDFRASLMRGELPLTTSYDFPKDELRPQKKAHGSVEDDTPPNTRTVTCMNMLYCMLWRELTLDMWSSFHRAADGTFPFCPGINPEGPEWDNAKHYLDEHLNACDFDVSNWDGFLSPDLAFVALEIICELNGYEKNSPEELALRAIITEVMFGYIQHGRVIYQKSRGIISGFPGTAEFNTLCHIILIIYIYLVVCKKAGCLYMASLQQFFDNCSLLVYGDDIIITISDEILGFWNGLTIAAGYEEIGYPITSASKDKIIPRSKPLLECSFLKSTWRRLTSNLWIRKMDLSVAHDLLYWERAGDTPLEQFYSNIDDCLRILFGHGKSVYTECRDRLNGWLTLAGLPIVLISYDDLYRDHMHRYYVDYY